MSTPTTDFFKEIISAQSSLNMEPEPIPGVTTGYLSDQDVWAQHAMEHIQQALLLLHDRDAEKLAVKLKRKFPDLSDDKAYVLASLSLKFLLQGE